MIPNRQVKPLQRCKKETGFTLVELVLVILVVGILSTVAISRYRDLGRDAKESACKSALMSLRSAIHAWEAKQIASTGQSQYPEIDSIRAGGVVLASAVPANPFQAADRAPDSVVTGVTRGQTVGTRGGWAYKPSTGEIWPNTSTSYGGGGGCGATEDAVNENLW